jgi:hypothetical protein
VKAVDSDEQQLYYSLTLSCPSLLLKYCSLLSSYIYVATQVLPFSLIAPFSMAREIISQGLGFGTQEAELESGNVSAFILLAVSPLIIWGGRSVVGI